MSLQRALYELNASKLCVLKLQCVADTAGAIACLNPIHRALQPLPPFGLPCLWKEGDLVRLCNLKLRGPNT